MASRSIIFKPLFSKSFIADKRVTLSILFQKNLNINNNNFYWSLPWMTPLGMRNNMMHEQTLGWSRNLLLLPFRIQENPLQISYLYVFWHCLIMVGIAWLKRVFNKNEGTWKNRLNHPLQLFGVFSISLWLL